MVEIHRDQDCYNGDKDIFTKCIVHLVLWPGEVFGEDGRSAGSCVICHCELVYLELGDPK